MIYKKTLTFFVFPLIWQWLKLKDDGQVILFSYILYPISMTVMSFSIQKKIHIHLTLRIITKSFRSFLIIKQIASKSFTESPQCVTHSFSEIMLIFMSRKKVFPFFCYIYSWAILKKTKCMLTKNDDDSIHYRKRRKNNFSTQEIRT